jgi:hypothetical protein
MPSRRVRYSSWKPVITAMVVISTIMPSAMPKIDAPDISERKPVRRLPRV